MGNLIGLNIIETTIPEAPNVPVVDSTSSGIILTSPRGVVGKPLRVTSSSQVKKYFGRPTSDTTGINALVSLFDNANPYSLNVYANRVIGANSVVASYTYTAANTNSLVFKRFDTGTDYKFVVSAGTNEGVKIEFTDTGDVVLETHDDLTLENIVDKINFGIGSTASAIMSLYSIGGVLPDIGTTDETGWSGAYISIATANPGTGSPELKIEAGFRGDVDPGEWANIYGFQFTQNPNDPFARDLTVYEVVNGINTQVGSTITGITYANLASKINAANGSEYIKVNVNFSALPDAGAIIMLSGGDDGDPVDYATFVGTSGASTGLYSFNAINISLMSCFDVCDLGDEALDFYHAMKSYLETNKPDVVGLVNAKKNDTIASIEAATSSNSITWNKLLAPKSPIAGYKGFYSIRNENNEIVWVPGCAGVLGAGYVREMFDQTGIPSVAPAGNGAAIRGVIEMDESYHTPQDLEYLTHTLGFNAIELRNGVGYIPRTSRTFSTQNKYYDIHKFRSQKYLTDILRINTSFVEQKPNSPQTRRLLVSTIDFITQEMYRKGMFDTNLGYNGAVSIKCDTDNNTEEDILNRVLNCVIGVRYVNISETVFIKLASVERSLTIQEL